MSKHFRIEPAPTTMPAAKRQGYLDDPRFGQVFTDHMVTLRYVEGEGWTGGAIGERKPFTLDPACAALHYAQEIFEGMKAYRQTGGDIALFRPEANARRFNDSARRMAMPELPEDMFLEAVSRFVSYERDWIPGSEGHSLYLRPFMFATEAFLGVRPAREFLFSIIATPAGGYFKKSTGLKLWVSTDYVRAVRGGTGAAKCGGNYAASLLAQSEAIAQGCDQILFLDAMENRWIEELGSMNIFFVMDDGSIVTPPKTGTILPGITRDSIVTLARDLGYTVREELFSIDQMQSAAQSGALVESFVCGTAAVVAPVGEVCGKSHAFTLPTPQAGGATEKLSKALLDIYYGRAEDRFGWITKVA